MLLATRTSLRNRQSQRRPAAATVELAVLLPFLVFLAVIATDWARLLYHTITIEACARNGAIYASDADYASKAPYADFAQAALAEGVDTTGLTATTATSGTTTTVTYKRTSGAVVVSVARTTGLTDSTGHAAILVTVTMPFNTITNFPGVPNSQTLTRSNQMRTAELLIK